VDDASPTRRPGDLEVDTGVMRIVIRVKPASARPGVGGEHGGALVVRVSARAVDGRATEAALAAVAASFGVGRSAVRLVSGASSRTKVIDIDAEDPRTHAALLAAPGHLPGQSALAARSSITSDLIVNATRLPMPVRSPVTDEILHGADSVRMARVGG
jgi:uncharacterized protein